MLDTIGVSGMGLEEVPLIVSGGGVRGLVQWGEAGKSQ